MGRAMILRRINGSVSTCRDVLLPQLDDTCLTYIPILPCSSTLLRRLLFLTIGQDCGAGKRR